MSWRKGSVIARVHSLARLSGTLDRKESLVTLLVIPVLFPALTSQNVHCEKGDLLDRCDRLIMMAGNDERARAQENRSNFSPQALYVRAFN